MFQVDTRQAILEHGTGQRGSGLSEAALDIIAQPADPTMSSAVIVGTAQGVEALLLAATGIGIYAGYLGHGQAVFYLVTTLVTVLAANVLLNAARTHRIPIYRTVVQQLGRVLIAWAIVLVGAALMAAPFVLRRYV